MKKKRRRVFNIMNLDSKQRFIIYITNRLKLKLKIIFW